MGALAGESVGWGVSAGKKLRDSRAAQQELAEICAAAIEASVEKSPALAEDLRSETFVAQVLIPTVASSVDDPSQIPDTESLIAEFINRFVTRFTNDDTVDETLTRIFHSGRQELEHFFTEFFASLKSGLYQSKHWRAEASLQTLEATNKIAAKTLEIVEEMRFAATKKPIDIEKAKEDAFEGSSDLRAWPKDILGERIARPAFNRILKHIASNKSGTSLIIGEAGSGKSALMAELTEHLEQEGTPVFAIKADILRESSVSLSDLEIDLGLEGNLLEEISVIADEIPTVVLIDQLDAVSEVMDQSSNRMRLLIGLVRKIRNLRSGAEQAPVHVVVSSRPFEAAHDARFKQLEADDEFQLELPSWETVAGFLDKLGIDPSQVAESLQDTLRRPFALKLYVEIIKRGESVENLLGSQLLSRWLASCDLGSDEQRNQCIELMTVLAKDMIASEALWRPIDTYESKWREALLRCEAAGLVVRQEPNLGFSHQSWLDDFQARSFSSGHDLAEYVWEKQDSLFVRATVLRSLQRLRWVDIDKYRLAIDALLSSNKTRRHVRHLAADIVSINALPDTIEIAWIERFIRDDSILARRSLSNVVKFWDGWRDHVRDQLPTLMRSEEYRWIAASLLAAEMDHDSDFATGLIEQEWDDAEFDYIAFRTFEQAELFTDRIKEHLQKMFGRSQIDDYGVSHLIRTLNSDGRFVESADVLALWIEQLEVDRYRTKTLYDLHKFAEKAPAEFVRVLLPWFVGLAQSAESADFGYRNQYARVDVLPWDWDDPVNKDDPFAVLEAALKKLAEENPGEAWAVLEPVVEIEIDQVQELIAGTLVAAGENLLKESFEFLMADDRRLFIGNPTVALRDGAIGSVPGLISQELIEAVSPHLPVEKLELLRDKIEAWQCYEDEELQEGEASLRRDRQRWTDQFRLAMLERFPQDKISARRRRQILEWRAKNPRHLSRSRHHMASFVGSPMDHEQMGKASDDAIMGMLGKINDVSPEGDRLEYPTSRSGGVVEVSRAFGAFGKQHPDRAIAIALDRLEPGKHEYTAGELVDQLGGGNGQGDKPDQKLAQKVHDLVLELTKRGFHSDKWYQRAASALGKVAGILDGLPHDTLELLESWLECDPDTEAKQIQDRLEFEERHEKTDTRHENECRSIMFDHGIGGMRILPHHNYTILSAIHHGLTYRDEADCDGWLEVLQRHVDRLEDPAIWQAVLSYLGRALFWADRGETQKFVRQLWEKDPSIFESLDVVVAIWPIRGMVPEDLLLEMLNHWLGSDNLQIVQCAAEFVTAESLVNPDNSEFAALARTLPDGDERAKQGYFLATAAAWKEDSHGLRGRSHDILINALPQAAGDDAKAISRAVDRRRKLQPDQHTREFLEALLGNDEAFDEALGFNFAEALQTLLLHADFDELLLDICGKATEVLANDKNGQDRLLGRELVQVCISLMRNDSAIRKRAMDIYEALLDLNIYGAEEAVRDATGR
ncbi:ATP-binding protein [Erythrobacter sp. SCSIO 43205]|uniref:NACHT domain-containing protein n=1 Tax=Erythrobacter sp. SCSIO 43205 TaxID=2779361 RepID=UPI001CA98E4B|nr:ATP-binding protein [Erythrobacter sp. SCSIO 43205]UAB79225.1 ATP-binding protein [Erythrobacter sp. SCSIO 43205]